MAGKWHFAFCIDEKYAQYASVCIRSILMHNTKQELHIHILSDHLTEQAIKRLSEASESERCEITFHHINEQELNGLPLNIWPIQAWYRILLPEIISPDIDRVLYLDCDTLVLSDLSELFDMDISGYAFAAVEDPQSYADKTFERCMYPKEFKYICTGIMLFNLEYWRGNSTKDQIIKYAITNKDIIQFPDQDCINAVCYNCKIILPFRYGVMDAFFKNEIILASTPKSVLIECLKNPAIIHFAGCAPWLKELRPSIYSHYWDKVNRTLKHKAKVKYISRGIRFVKMVGYKLLHPVHTYHKRANILTLKKAYRLIENI